MSTYSKFLELVSGTATTIDLSSAANTLGVANMQLLGSTSGTLTHVAAATTTPYALTWPSAVAGTNGFALTSTTGGVLSWSAVGTGTVTSVAFADSTNLFNVTGSPVTSSGTLTLSSFKSQAQNAFLAGPSTGGAGTAAFRAIAGADLPNPSATTLGGIESYAAVTHQWINAISTSGVPSSTQPAFTDISGSVAASQMPALTGDVTTSAGTVATSLVATSNGTLTTLSALTTASALASVGTITSGTWNATTIAINHGGTGVTSATTTPTASAFAAWDANKNMSANSFIAGYTTTATAAGTTTLVVGSTQQQYFTGSTTQTVVMPVTSTLVLGQSFTIVNSSSGVVTVQSSGANTIQAMGANSQLVLTVVSTSLTTAAAWNAEYSTATGGTVTSVALALPVSVFTVSGSPVTTSGTLTGTFANQNANQVFAGPASGGATTPAFRALVSQDIPTDNVTIDQNGASNTIEVLNAPAVKRILVAGQTFTANTSYAVRWGLTSNGETAGRVYAADITTSSFNLYYVIGMASSAAGATAGGNITVTLRGAFSLSSADTAFASNSDGLPIFLTATGTFSTTAPSTSGQAVTRIGMIQIRSATVTSNIIDVAPQTIGVN